MNTFFRVGLVCAMLTIHGVAQTTIKGHHLGETAQDFLRTESEIAARLDSCVYHEHVVTALEVNGMSEMRALLVSTTTAMMLSLPNKPNRNELKALADDKKVITINEPNRMDGMLCFRLITALVTGGTKDLGATPTSESPIWTFSGGKLVAMAVAFSGATFPTVEADLSKRIGMSSNHTTPVFQNALGAHWNDNDSTWLSQELFADLHESNNPAAPSLKLTVQSRALYDQALRKRAQTPSPLD